MDDHPAKLLTQESEVGLGNNRQSSEVTPQLALEWNRLRLERQKYALEVRLKRRELREKEHKNLWQNVLINPVTIAIVGGLITVITALVTNYFNASETRRADADKAQLAEQNAKETLQADLIKKFVESPRTDTVRQNLRFLVDAGLIPSYADSIRKYLDSNPGVAPQVGGGVEFVPSGASVAEDVKARIQKAVNQFITYLQSLGFHGLDQNVTSVTLDSTDNFTWNEIELSLALYLPASFTNSPIIGTILGPSVRKLDSATSYDRSAPLDSDFQLAKGLALDIPAVSARVG